MNLLLVLLWLTGFGIVVVGTISLMESHKRRDRDLLVKSLLLTLIGVAIFLIGLLA